MVLLLLFRTVTILQFVSGSTSGSVFIEEPGPGPVLSPVGTPVELNCTVSQGFIVEWSVDPPDILPVRLPTSQMRTDTLMNHGIMALYFGSQNSQLVISGLEQNSPTTVLCIAVVDSRENSSRPVEVIIYGPPPAPTELNATENGPGSLNISWLHNFIEEVRVNFTLTATNLNASSAEPMVISGIQDQHYVFTVENRCDVYSFQVTAMATGVNRSDPSTVLTRTIPATPADISPVEHSLAKTSGDGFILVIKIQNVNVCSEYPTVSYTVVVVDDRNRSVNQTVPSENNITTINISELVSDTRYRYYIFASNQFGDSRHSTSVQIITTDVQRVSICLVGGTTYSIQCSYVMGSDALGCVYFIMGNEKIISDNLTRSNSGIVTFDLANITCFREVLAYDWESDGTIGTLPVQVNSTTIIMCPSLPTSTTIATTLSRDSSCSTSNILVSVLTAISTALLATVIFVLVQIALCKCRPKATPGGAESAPSAGGEGQVVYEQVDAGGEGVVAVGGPTYMEVQAVKKDTFALKTNEAYGSVIAKVT